jgi:predicted DNA-binding protein YlxM (UPF0122 family)
MKTNKWNKETLAELRKHAASGLTLRELGDLYGIKRQAIAGVMKRHRIMNLHQFEAQYNLPRDVDSWVHLNAQAHEGDPLFQKYLTKKSWCATNLVDFSIEFGDMVWPTHCPIFGVELNYNVRYLEESAEMDRIRPDLGYIPGNVAIISRRANRHKGNATADELQKIVNFIRDNT